MKKIIIGFLTFATLSIVLTYSVVAQYEAPVGNLSTEVTASVGEFYLTVSGYQSPFASIVMNTIDGVFLSSITADSQGNFTFPAILIKRGFIGFCLTAIDFKRLGESVTCFNLEPATNDIVMTDLFLPPTLGLSRAEISAGGSAQAFGYTMPGATVTLHLSNGTTLTTTADSAGYYTFSIDNLPVGTYEVYTTAVYQGNPSLSPSKKQQVKVLALTQKLPSIPNVFSFDPLIWAGLLLLIIIALLVKLFRHKLSYIYTTKLYSMFHKVPLEKQLHHAWFVGY